MAVRSDRMLVRRFAVFLRRPGVRLGVVVLALFVMMSCLMVVMRRRLVRCGGVLMMLVRRMLGALRHV